MSNNTHETTAGDSSDSPDTLTMLLQQAINSDSMKAIITHKDFPKDDPAVLGAMKNLAGTLVAQTDIIDSRGQAVMKDAGVDTISHPDNSPRGSNDGQSGDSLSDIAKQAARAVAKEQEAQRIKDAPRKAEPPQGLFSGLLDLAKHAVTEHYKSRK